MRGQNGRKPNNKTLWGKKSRDIEKGIKRE